MENEIKIVLRNVAILFGDNSLTLNLKHSEVADYALSDKLKEGIKKIVDSEFEKVCRFFEEFLEGGMKNDS